MKTSLFERFKKYEVCANSLQEFCNIYHRQKYEGDQAKTDYKDHKRDLETTGFTFIPCHDSITGEIVSYYGKI